MSVCERCTPAHDRWLIQPFRTWGAIRFRTHDGKAQLDVLQAVREERRAIQRNNLEIIERNCVEGRCEKNQ